VLKVYKEFKGLLELLGRLELQVPKALLVRRAQLGYKE
jgi:hypothetical protein